MAKTPLIEAPTSLRLDVLGVDEVISIHRQHALYLVGQDGRDGKANIGGNPYALVTELLRLARAGAIAEEQARSVPNQRVSQTVAEARGRWRVEIGGA